MAKKSEEQIWLDSVKRRLIKYISNPKWDYIELSDLQMSIVMAITNCENVNNLSPSINERVTDNLFEVIKSKMSKVKLTYGHSSEKEF
ncbi:MAG: hypothetical protein IJX17_08360 [Clostridia bacterium]|nr:hypothetical protein [Clostridia bacterium]